MPEIGPILPLIGMQELLLFLLCGKLGGWITGDKRRWQLQVEDQRVTKPDVKTQSLVSVSSFPTKKTEFPQKNSGLCIKMSVALVRKC